MARDFTNQASLVSDDLTDLQPGDSGAAILDAVSYSVSLLQKEPEDRLRVLLLISETRDHGSHAKIDATVAAIGQSNALMYALAFSPALSNILDTGRGTNKDEMNASPDLLAPLVMTMHAMRKNVPKTIAEMTGGEYELFATRKKFEVRMNDFTNHLHSRYLLSIAPKKSPCRPASDSSAVERPCQWHYPGENRLLGRRKQVNSASVSTVAGAARFDLHRIAIPAPRQAFRVNATLLWLQAGCQLFALFLLPSCRLLPSIQIESRPARLVMTGNRFLNQC